MVNCPENRYVERCLNRLAVEIGARPAGSLAHQAAADFIAGEMQQVGYEVIWQKYPCPDWQAFFCELTVAGKKILASVNTYSPSCDIEAELVPVTSDDELRQLDLTGKFAMVHGEIVSSSFFPRNFDRRYYMVESQDRFLELLENSKPGAIVMVNHYDGPLPVLLEDSDWVIPSVTVSRHDGLFVMQNAGTTARLRIISARRTSTGSNIIGQRCGKIDKKILLCAHYDTKPGTPGAMDNAAGIAALLLLIRYLERMETKHSIEIVAYGGEDSWFPGDALYIEEYPPDNIAAVINIDGIGMKDSKTAISFFEFHEQLAGRIMDIAQNYGEYVQEQFYASDHGFFWPLGIPTLALTTSGYMDMNLVGKVVHTENDRLDIVDTLIIKQTAGLVRDIINLLDQHGT